MRVWGMMCFYLDAGALSRVEDYEHRLQLLLPILVCNLLRFGNWVSGFGIRVSGFGNLVSGFGIQVSDLGIQVSGFGFRDSRFDPECPGGRVPQSVFETLF